MFDAHPEVALAYETHFLARPLRRLDGLPDRELDDATCASILEHRYFPRLGLDEASVERVLASSETLSDLVRGLYAAFAAARGKRVAGEKSPHYVKVLPALHALLPEARCIHVVRDGRDVALSMLDWERRKEKRTGKGPWAIELWDEEPLAVCALWWAVYLRNADIGREALGPERFLEVRYEDLTRDPETTLAALCAFLDLPEAPEMLRYHEGRTRDDAALSTKQRWLPLTAGLRDWHTQLAAQDQAFFQALAGPVLEARGYPAAPVPATDALRERARACLDWWNANVEHDDMRLPELAAWADAQ